MFWNKLGKNWTNGGNMWLDGLLSHLLSFCKKTVEGKRDARFLKSYQYGFWNKCGMENISNQRLGRGRSLRT